MLLKKMPPNVVCSLDFPNQIIGTCIWQCFLVVSRATGCMSSWRYLQVCVRLLLYICDSIVSRNYNSVGIHVRHESQSAVAGAMLVSLRPPPGYPFMPPQNHGHGPPPHMMPPHMQGPPHGGTPGGIGTLKDKFLVDLLAGIFMI